MHPHFLVLFCILSSFHGLSQTLIADVGISVTRLSFDLGPDTRPGGLFEKPFIGFAMAAGIQYHSSKHVDISGKLGVIQKGGRSDITRSAYNTAGPELNYLTWTNPFRVKYPVTETILPFLTIGPHAQYLFSYSNHFAGLEENGELRRFNYGLFSGLGASYVAGAFEFGIKGEYYFDFNPVVNIEPSDNNSGVKATTRTYTISVTCSYDLGF